MTPVKLVLLFVYLVLMAFIVFILIKIRKRSKRNKVIDYDQAKLTIDADYKCPKCNEDMGKGYIVAGKGIIWRKDQDKITSMFATIFRALENTINFTMSMKENKAWRCENCKYILVDHSTLVGKVKRKK